MKCVDGVECVWRAWSVCARACGGDAAKAWTAWKMWRAHAWKVRRRKSRGGVEVCVEHVEDMEGFD